MSGRPWAGGPAGAMGTLGGELPASLGAIHLDNGMLRATVLAGKGADIYALVDKTTAIDVLFKTPWGLRAPGPWPAGGNTKDLWLGAYGGGWQLLLPNGGDECTEKGATWGFHGEASMVAWQVLQRSETSATLRCQLFSAPLEVVRRVSLEGAVLRVHEKVANSSPGEVEFMWSHHPAFGAPFLDAGCRLSAGCRTVVADDRAPGTVLAPGSRHPWPTATGRDGSPMDLGQVPGPEESREVFAYLLDFEKGFFSITNPRLGLQVRLRWPLAVFDKAWLWQEVGSTGTWPWFRRAYALAVEPATTVPGQGMACARAKGADLARLGPHESREAWLEMEVSHVN